METHTHVDCCADKADAKLKNGTLAKSEVFAKKSDDAVKKSSCCESKAERKHSHGNSGDLTSGSCGDHSRGSTGEHSHGSCGDHSHSHSHDHSHAPRRAVAGDTNVFSTVVGDEILVSADESKAHQEHHKQVQRTLLLDNLGIFASTLCLVHCMAMPFLIAFLPFLGLQFLEGEVAHRVIALFVFAFAIFAIGPSYLQHRKKQVLFATILGLSLVAGALLIAGPIFGEKYELPFITTGNLILVITHLRNKKLCECAH